jgi:hypothetical protein
MYCYKCSREIVLEVRPRREDICPDCSAYLHCCFNCRFYDVKAPNQCREPMAVPVKEKDLGNVCHYFESSREKPDIQQKRKMDESRRKLDDLFKK